MAPSSAGTVVGFVNTNMQFFGKTHTTTSTEYIEVVLSKPVGRGASLSVTIDGRLTDVTTAANTNAFAIVGNQSLRNMQFGFIKATAQTGTVHIVGCTGGSGADDAPLIIRPPLATIVAIR